MWTLLTAATVHSNALTTCRVLSTTPAAGSKVNPGSQVMLNVAQNTTAVDLIVTAHQACWSSGAGTLTFPHEDTDTTGFVLIRDNATLEDRTIATVLEISPQQVNNGYISGVYELAKPAMPGDHLPVRVGLLTGAAGQVTPTSSRPAATSPSS